MDLHLSGKMAVVTGAGRGIGLAVARGLVAEGAVVVAGTRSASADLTALASGSASVHPVVADLATPDGVAALAAAADALGDVDILVNNVGGVVRRTGGFLSMTDADWAWGLERNLMVAVRLCRAVLPAMVERRSGTILNVSSVNAIMPDPDVYDYSAAKAATTNFSKALAKEFGPHGIRVNSVSPGPVRTGMWTSDTGVAPAAASAYGISQDEFMERVAAMSVTGRFSTTEEVADLIVLLACDRVANLVGADVVIDGGLVPAL